MTSLVRNGTALGKIAAQVSGILDLPAGNLGALTPGESRVTLLQIG